MRWQGSSGKGRRMSRFVVLLGGSLSMTPRLQQQVAGARAIAADSGMVHAEPLGLDVELWVGDFDSTGDDLARRYAAVERQAFPAAKNATDGELAVGEALKRGAREIVLVGAFGGQTDHMLGHANLALGLALAGHKTFLTSGREEAYPVLPGTRTIGLPDLTRFSIIPFSDLEGLDLENVRWPLIARNVPLGSTLTLSNIALGPVTIGLKRGYGIAVAYPAEHDH
jgi:thiamine pyrophosphokinase